MENFTYHNPTKIVFGTGNLHLIGEETKLYGKRALLVYGQKSLKGNGVYEQVIDSLKKAKVEIVEHPGVRPNPVLSHATEGVRLCEENEVNVIVAAGGGSVIDEARSIAAGAVKLHGCPGIFDRRYEEDLPAGGRKDQQLADGKKL